jgi:hypothetical protein
MKYFNFILLALSLSVFPWPVNAAHHSPYFLLKKIRNEEPKFLELVAAAFREEKLDWGEVSLLKRKMKQAPWLPVLSVGYDRQFRKDQSVSFNDNISVTSSAVTVGPPDNNQDFSINHDDVFRVRASWDLSEVIFHPAELKLQDTERNVSVSRVRLMDSLYKTYSERRKLLTQYFLLVPSDSTKKILLGEQIHVLAERIDAFTGGVFTNRWWSDEREVEK